MPLKKGDRVKDERGQVYEIIAIESDGMLQGRTDNGAVASLSPFSVTPVAEPNRQGSNEA